MSQTVCLVHPSPDKQSNTCLIHPPSSYLLPRSTSSEYLCDHPRTTSSPVCNGKPVIPYIENGTRTTARRLPSLEIPLYVYLVPGQRNNPRDKGKGVLPSGVTPEKNSKPVSLILLTSRENEQQSTGANYRGLAITAANALPPTVPTMGYPIQERR